MTDPYYQDEHVTLWHGDCRDVLPALPDASVDSVVTDPPYELGFMGKGWDATGIAYNATVWRECLRVLKPGGHLLAFGGTRTWHRLAVAIEDAGFELRDSIAWLYSQGFPKSLDVSKAIDKAAGAEREVVGTRYTVKRWNPGATVVSDGEWGKQNVDYAATNTLPATPDAERWQGWGTALKPAFEPVVVARKPLEGTVAANALTWGTGALNVDGCRVAGDEDGSRNRPPSRIGSATTYAQDEWTRTTAAQRQDTTGKGRWPANVVLDEHAAAELDRQSGTLTSGKQLPTHKRSKQRMGASGIYGASAAPEADPLTETYGDSGGASRFFPTFRYEAKAPTSERPRYHKSVLRLRDDLTPEQVGHVRARLAEAGVRVD